MRTLTRSLAGTALVALIVPLAACGTEEGGMADDPESAPPAESVGYEYPTGPDDVVLEVITAGGYTSADYQFKIRPDLYVTGDGRVFTTGPVPAIYPGPRMLPLHQVEVDAEAMQDLLGLADDAELLADPPNYDMAEGMMVTDLPTTTVTITADGATHEHAAYGLGFGDDPAYEEGNPPQTETPARRRLAQFIADARALLVPDDSTATLYEPEQLQLYVVPGGRGSEGADAVDWPADGPDLSGPEGCRVVTAVPDVVDLLLDSNGAGAVKQGKGIYMVSGAMVLPGETPCENW